MATSGTTAFNMDLTELVEEAFERAGSEMRTGYDLKDCSPQSEPDVCRLGQPWRQYVDD
jgi:hypothetical protein